MSELMKRGSAFLIFITLVVVLTGLSPRDLVTTLSLLLFSSVAFAIPARAGFFNLGVNAQLMAGALAAVAVMQHFRQQPLLAALLTLLFAGLAGAVTGAIPLALRQWTGVNEVISSILLNSLMVTVTSYLLRSGVESKDEASIKLIEFQSFDQVSVIAGGVLIIIGYIVFSRSFLWILASAHGESPTILRYSGFHPDPYMWLFVIVAAIVASCGAALRVLDKQGVFINGEFALLGFSGIVAATLLGDRPSRLFSACVLLAIIEVLRPELQVSYGVPKEAVATLEAGALLLLLLRKQRQEAGTQ